MGKIIHGNQSFGFATIDTTSTPKFNAPVMLPGMVSCDIEVEQEATKIYADNKVYFSLLGAKARTATATFRAITSAYAELLGFKKATNGMMTDTGTHLQHCIFFETLEADSETGEETRTLHYLYSVKGKEPSFSSSTDEDEVEAQEIEIEYECAESSFVKDADNSYVQYSYVTRTEANKTWYDSFTTKVLLPSDSITG